MKKHTVYWMLVGVLALSVITACASGNNESESADAANEAEDSMDDAEMAESESEVSDSESAQEEPTQESPPGIEMNIQVGPILVDCEGEGPQSCMLVREHEMDSWQLWYSGITGFEYEEGYLYDLIVEEKTVENPPAGGSSIAWALVEEVSKTPVTINNMIVGPEQVDCEGEGPQLCYQVKTDPDGDWQLFYSNIQGFEYEPGFEYEVVVAEIPVTNPPAGASSIQYLLVEEVSKTPVEPEEEESRSVIGTVWTATSIYGEPVVEESTILLGISPGRVGGTAGCNTYFGPVEVDGNKVAVGPLGTTRKACVDAIMEQENRYLTALESAAWVEIDGEDMSIYDDSGEIILALSNVEPLPLEGTPWVLSTYNNGENAMVSVLEETRVTANFEDDQVSGSAGCNNYFGSFEATEDTISIGPLASTMMLCAEPVNEQEQRFLAALESATSYQVIANRLELVNGEGALAAMFHAEVPVELPGTTWMVTGYNNGRGGVTSVIIGTELTVAFEDENLGGLAGCNNYTGSYEVDGDAISIGPLGVTRKFCSDPEGIMEQESEFLAALEGASTYEIQGDRMDMYFEDGARALTLEMIQG